MKLLNIAGRAKSDIAATAENAVAVSIVHKVWAQSTAQANAVTTTGLLMSAALAAQTADYENRFDGFDTFRKAVSTALHAEVLAEYIRQNKMHADVKPTAKKDTDGKTVKDENGASIKLDSLQSMLAKAGKYLEQTCTDLVRHWKITDIKNDGDVNKPLAEAYNAFRKRATEIARKAAPPQTDAEITVAELANLGSDAGVLINGTEGNPRDMDPELLAAVRSVFRGIRGLIAATALEGSEGAASRETLLDLASQFAEASVSSEADKLEELLKAEGADTIKERVAA